MQNENDLNSMNLNEDTINIREELEKYAYYWKWFVVSAFLALTLAFIYLRYTPNEYEVATTILIDDEDNGGAGSLAAFQDLGFLGNSQTSIDNEIELLKSRSLMESVIKSLNLNVSHFFKGTVKNTELMLNQGSVKTTFFVKDSLFYSKDTTFTIIINSIQNFSLKNSDGAIVGSHSFGETIETSMGSILITPNKIDALNKGDEIIVNIQPLTKVVENYRNAIQIEPVNKNASVIELRLKDQVKEKAKLILNKLVFQYNANTVKDKSLIGENTEEFINGRLEIITKNLATIDKGVEEFKKNNKLTDIVSEAGLTLDANAEIEKQLLDLNTQLKLIEYVNDYVDSNSSSLIPANLGLSDKRVSENTIKYNELVLERNRILKSSSDKNPIIVNLNAQINQLKETIVQSLVNLKSSVTISLKEVKNQEYRLNKKITAVPGQERQYRDMQRQQQIVEALYLYLLEKREENAITLAVTQPNAKIIDTAYGSSIPVAPRKKIIMLVALLLGFMIPFIFIYIKFLLDNKVHGKKDIENLFLAPILGDIPKTIQTKKVVISGTDRSGIAEAFRLLRTNINFMFTKVKTSSKTIFLSSTISGEGKTFIAINLASVLATSSKKVLLIGADIRNPKIIDYLNIENSKGLTHYLRDGDLNCKDVVNTIDSYGFDMIHSGVIPPNPAELLMNGRFEKVIEWGRENYDYVIVDTAPVSLVTDTLLISSAADLFIYVIRANYLDRRLLEVPKTLYQEQRIPNMAVLINGTDYEKGYGYGYGYGYGEQTIKEGFSARIKKRFKK